MQNFIEKKNQLTDNEVTELLYYFRQGIEVGKEEIYMSVINNMISLNMDYNTICKVTNLSTKKIKNYID